MKKYVIVVDMQKDFVTGVLGTKEAQEIVAPMRDYLMDCYADEDTCVFFTQDTHYDNYMETQEGKFLPVPHCIAGTDGWGIVDELNFDNLAVFQKDTFGSTWLLEHLTKQCMIKGYEPESFTFVGVCTDICVVSNALLFKAFFKETPVHVIEALTAGVTPEKKEAALETMRSCQIIID